MTDTCRPDRPRKRYSILGSFPSEAMVNAEISVWIKTGRTNTTKSIENRSQFRGGSSPKYVQICFAIDCRFFRLSHHGASPPAEPQFVISKSTVKLISVSLPIIPVPGRSFSHMRIYRTRKMLLPPIASQTTWKLHGESELVAQSKSCKSRDRILQNSALKWKMP
jgi:hypothetical protein